tara:strand:+ start:41 stop:805 length:765 start_codon:yes stop_codon:yes gene_type:complete
MIITGNPAGIYKYWYEGKVNYVGQSGRDEADIFKRSRTRHKGTDKKLIPYDAIEYFSEEKYPWLSDERYRRFFESRMIYKNRSTLKQQKIPKHLLDLNIFLEKVFLWEECAEAAFLNFTSNYRPYANNYPSQGHPRFFKDTGRWHRKGSNWIHNDYSFFSDGLGEWNPPYKITKPLYLNGECAFYALIKKNFQYDSSNKPWDVVIEVDPIKNTRKEKTERLLLKNFAIHCRTKSKIGKKRAEEYEKILSRKLHN